MRYGDASPTTDAASGPPDVSTKPGSFRRPRGRTSERATLRQLLASVRAGAGGVLVIRGDPGIGKTALLDDVAATHQDLTIERIVEAEAEAEAEAELAFAGVQRLILRHRDFVDELPAPQRHALLVMLGVEFGPPPDRFLVGLGVHALLGLVATSWARS